jgi:hypothetical protein
LQVPLNLGYLGRQRINDLPDGPVAYDPVATTLHYPVNSSCMLGFSEYTGVAYAQEYFAQLPHGLACLTGRCFLFKGCTHAASVA